GLLPCAFFPLHPFPGIFVGISGEKPIHWRQWAYLPMIWAIWISISGEKPIHWRLGNTSTCDKLSRLFQSQARSQSTGDAAHAPCLKAHQHISISGEKPIHWRLDQPRK